MALKLLSICIPTYNFGTFIGQTLDSILPNIREGVEVIILDGGSTDDTGQVVAQRQQNCPQLQYYRQEFRGGIDRDIAKVVSLAHGEYCWLFSADDIMKPGAVDTVLNEIRSHCDIYLCEHTLCDYEMHPIKAHPIFNGIHAPEIFDLGNTVQRKRYFKAARTTEAFFSFLSGPIFRRDLWERSGGIPESFYGTCWALAGRLLRLIPNGLMVHYLAVSLIYKRSGNDSFLEHGVVNRLRISVEGFAHISETIFGKDSYENYHIRRVIRHERTLPHLLGIKLIVATSTQKNKMAELDQLVFRHYSNAGIGNVWKYKMFGIMPIPLLKMGLLLRNMMKKKYNVPKAVNI